MEVVLVGSVIAAMVYDEMCKLNANRLVDAARSPCWDAGRNDSSRPQTPLVHVSTNVIVSTVGHHGLKEIA